EVLGELATSVDLSDAAENALRQLLSLRGSSAEVIASLQPLVEGADGAMEGLNQLRQMASTLSDVGIDPARYRIDASMARGLDYYTGPVFETVLDDLPEIGSVCSGGRYDNLAELFTKQQLPGVG
ncbi:MAG: histidine--tRNA ligase, partial [Burkholderiales bacterium]|nr:histidine--tRNA ligase [Burkholderiales bacterium]